MSAFYNLKDNRDAFDVMESLGITYDSYQGSSLIEDVKFFGCKGVPTELPESITIIN